MVCFADPWDHGGVLCGNGVCGVQGGWKHFLRQTNVGQMRLSNLLFRDVFEVKADYEKVRNYLRLRLNETYYKGYIDRDEIQLFFASGGMGSVFTSLPLVQVNIENKIYTNGKIRVKVKLVDFVLWLFGIANASIILSSIPDIGFGDNGLPIEAAPFPLILTYSFLQIKYLGERSILKHEMKLLEKSQNS